MGLYNKESGYGKHSQTYPFMGGGQVFVVARSAAAGRKILQDTFGAFNGRNRFAATIDAAINLTTASRGDVILVAPNHTETITSIAAIALDVAGVSVIGLGVGNNRPVVTITSTDNTGSIAISANNCKWHNIVVVGNDDALTNAMNVTGNNCDIDFEYQDTSAAIEAATVVRLDTADNTKLKVRIIGFVAGNAMVSAIRVDDCDNVRIDVDFYGIVSTAVVEFVDVLSTDVHVTGRMYTSGVTNFTRTVVDTITSSIWSANFLDATANVQVSGGNVAALASDDASAIAALLVAPTADVTTTTNMRDSVGIKTDAAVTAVGTTKSIIAYVKGLIAMGTVQSADSTNNAFAGDVTGNKTDAVLADTVEGTAATTKTLVAMVKSIMQRIGADSANNSAATTLVTANADGSQFERLEYIQTDMLAVPRCVEKSDGAVLSGDDNIFDITGGPIKILEITGIVTTTIGAGTTNGKITLTTVEPAATVDLSAGAVDIDGDVAGTSYQTINTTGVFTPVTAGFVKEANSFATLPTTFLGPIGTLKFNSSAARTGNIKWYLRYVPLSPLSRVVASA